MKMSQEELNEVLRLHELWLEGDAKGKRADLRGADLKYANLKEADLEKADLSGVDLSGANLENARLSEADLNGSIFYNAVLYRANLEGAKLRRARLEFVSLKGANLREANLKNACLIRSDLKEANLESANLFGTLLGKSEKIRKGLILTEPMIGYKKCRENIIVTLEIPKGATVFSINNSKCRTNRAKVVHISGGYKEAFSYYDNNFVYELGKEIDLSKTFDTMYN